MLVEFKDSDGAWPGWSRNVATMYAGHIAVNTLLEKGRGPSVVDGNALDSYPYLPDPIGPLVRLIHAWHHSYGLFSKHDYHDGAYADHREGLSPASAPPPDSIREYCLWIALHSEALPWHPRRLAA